MNTCDPSGNILGVGSPLACKKLVCHASCKQCNAEYLANKCTSCPTGAYLSNGYCLSCTASLNCVTCSSATTCLTCPSGMYVQPSGACQLPCHSSCLSCSVPADSTKCTTCNAGSYLTNGQCLTCPTSIGCTDCVSATECRTCPANYTMQANKSCKATCHAYCNTCSKPLDYYSCTSCIDGYWLQGSVCVNCYWPCKTCSTTQSTCTSCVAG